LARGTLTDLGVLGSPGDNSFSNALAVSKSGVIAGYASDTSASFQDATVWIPHP